MSTEFTPLHFVSGLIFVVDCSDRERLGEARNELFRLLLDEEMMGKPVVIMANKSDVPGQFSALKPRLKYARKPAN
jgi:signal recognition particle receptor subunit beta